MKRLNTLLLGILFGYLGLVIYANRAAFMSKFDAVYWKDKYDHSQWKLPLSVRTLGDDGLYLYEGYRIVQGKDPTLANAEVPPIGKYLIGTSILMFGNGYIYGFVTTALAIGALGILAYLLTGNTTTALAASALTALDPLVAGQFSLTMLDSLQLLFLITFLISLVVATKSTRPNIHILAAIGAGVSLGFFSETKFPLFSPIFAIAGIVVLWRSGKNISYIFVFIVSACVAYLVPYIPYFFMNHSLRDWLKVQKWIVTFYTHSGLKPTLGSALTTLLTNQNQNLFTHSFSAVAEWSPVWPIVTIGGIIGLRGMLVRWRRRESFAWIPTAFITIFFLIFYSFIPFWTRYLVLVLPLLYLATARLFASKKLLPVVFVLLFINAICSFRILFPTPETTVKQFLYDWGHGFFQDTYERITQETRHVSRDQFFRFGMQTLYDTQIETAAIDLGAVRWSRWDKTQNIPLHITYNTRNLGPLTRDITIPVVYEKGTWRIPWQWSYVIDGLDETKHLETTVDEGKRGSILTSAHTPLGADIPSTMIWITPSKVDTAREEVMLKYLELLFERKIPGVAFHQRYAANNLPDMPVPVGVPPFELTPSQKAELTAFAGISLTPKFGRLHTESNIVETGVVGNTNFFECCSLLYSAANYNGTSGLEKQFNTTLKSFNGGSLLLKDARGHILKTIIQKEKVDGKDLQL